MTDIAIRIENLSKMYRIGRAKQRHDTLRDLMVDTLRAPFRGRDGSPEEDTIWALKDVSFEVKRGEVVGIIGRNGAGKSTLLKILTRITEPTRGSFDLYGRVSSLLEVGTGFHPELTGRENVYLNGAILGMRKAEIDHNFDEIVEFSGVEKFLDTPVKRYSSGMSVRLAFSVAAHLEPEILLVDEVLAVGDVEFQKRCLGKMDDVAKQGRTVLLVSHSMGSIRRLCSRCFLLNQGQLVSSGATRKVIQDYVLVGQQDSPEYLQSHATDKAMNLRRVALVAPDGHLLDSEVRYDQDFTVLVEYEVNQPVSNCTVWLALETPDGTMAFTTADSDTDLGMLEGREVGYYRTSVPIPSRWLNYGRYAIVVGLVSNVPLIVYDRVDALLFSVLEIGCPSEIHSGTRRGVFQPVLDWATQKLSPAPTPTESSLGELH